jgi:Ca-activated chloride channel homolog
MKKTNAEHTVLLSGNTLIKAVLPLIILLATLNFSCGESSSLSGKVINSIDAQGLNKVKVTLLKEGLYVKSSFTDALGAFNFTSVHPGTYALKFSAKGFHDTILSPVRIFAEKSSFVQVSLRLVLKKELALIEDDQEIMEELQVTRTGKGRTMSISQNCYSGGAYTVPAACMDIAYEPYNTENYDVINENIFKEVFHNPLSTFSVDVDRASYSNVRRFLNSSQKPPVDAVRIEEMINYFRYDYPQPGDEHPFTVNMEMGTCPWNENNHLVLIGIQGKEIMADQVPPGNFVFLIDVSGSMFSPNKLPLVKQSLKIMVDQLRPEDRVSMVVYAGAAGLVLEPSSGNDKVKIMAAIDRLEAGGSTAGGAGIRLAYKTAKENYIPKGNNRVILATDGDFNIGISSDAEMVRLIESYRDEGVFLSVLGFGMGNYKDSKMEKISNAGNGNYAYIDNIMEAKKIFGEELWGTLFTIAKDVKIQVEFNPAKVKAYRLIGYENRLLNKEDFNDDKKDAGDIGSGHTVTALYEIIPADSDTELPAVDPLEYQKASMVNSKNVMTIKLRYKKPDEDISNLIVQRLSEKDMQNKNPSHNFLFAASVAEFGMLLRNSEFKGNADYDKTLAMATKSKGADVYGYRGEFIKMVETAKLLSY